MPSHYLLPRLLAFLHCRDDAVITPYWDRCYVTGLVRAGGCRCWQPGGRADRAYIAKQSVGTYIKLLRQVRRQGPGEDGGTQRGKGRVWAAQKGHKGARYALQGLVGTPDL